MNFNQFKDLINRKIESYNKMLAKSHDYELGLVITSKLKAFREVKKWMDEVR